MAQIWTLIDPALNLEQQSIIVTEDEFHYAAHVLRLTTGTEVEIVNGAGIKAWGTITEITKKNLVIDLTKVTKIAARSPAVHLWLACPKPTTLEEVVASASELGATSIHLFKSERSASKAVIKKDKIQRISTEAMRISKSPFAAAIYEYQSLNDFYSKHVTLSPKKLILFCDECIIHSTQKNSIFTVLTHIQLKDIEEICVLIGAEASFTEVERAFILEKFQPTSVSLGNNILRVPNAVTSALGICLMLYL